MNTMRGSSARRRGPPRYDVCVVGGGPAGAAAALSARAAGASVSLVAPQQKSEHGSLELLSGKARASLVGMGLLDTVSSGAPSCIGTVSRWAGADFDERSCLLDPHGAGWIIDRGRLDAILRATAADRGVSVVARRVLQVVESPAGAPARIRLRDRDLIADRVIVAVGRAAGPVRRRVHRDIRRRIVAFDMVMGPKAIGGLGSRLLIDRAPNGWWYALGNGATTHAIFCTDAAALANGSIGVAATWREACRSALDWLPGVPVRRARSCDPSRSEQPHP